MYIGWSRTRSNTWFYSSVVVRFTFDLCDISWSRAQSSIRFYSYQSSSIILFVWMISVNLEDDLILDCIHISYRPLFSLFVWYQLLCSLPKFERWYIVYAVHLQCYIKCSLSVIEHKCWFSNQPIVIIWINARSINASDK